MPINAREMFLIIRAKDEASRVLRGLSATMLATGASADKATREAAARANHMIQFGSALASAGAGATIAGAAIEAGLFSAGKAAVEYNRQAALTATQTDNVSDAITKMGDIGKSVGKDIGVPFEQLQPTLYDLFSSLDIGVAEAKPLLKSLSKAAVAGQTDLQEASRATIAIMNSFDVPAKNVNDVLDFQFRLVQKGVGTYGEFARTIGRSIPSAVRAGQTYQTLGGMLAFLTRNGLSAAMASASAGRALDAISHPETVKKLEKMGVTVKKSNGEFRPMVGIIRDLQKELDGLTRPQRSKALYELFKSSGGTIQARRFFDAVLKDRHAVKELAGYTNDMATAGGTLEQKYKQMADTLAVKAELLSNRWKIIKISVGEQLMPVLERLVDFGGDLIKFWNGLDDSTKKNIVTFTALAGGVLILFGVLSTLAGGVIMITGALDLMGVSLLGVLGTTTLLVGAVGLLAYGFKEGNTAALALGGALATLLIVKTLGPMFQAFSSGLGSARAGMNMYSEAVKNGQSRTSALRDTISTGFAGAGTKMMGGLKGLISFLGGPWGIAIMAAGAVLGQYMAAQRRAAARVQEHTDALDAQTGALTKANRAIVVKQLSDSGAIASARALGISTRDLVDAALGLNNADRKVNDALKTQEHTVGILSNTTRGHTRAVGAMTDEQRHAQTAIDRVRDVLGQSSGELSKARQKWIDFTEGMAEGGDKAEVVGGQIAHGLARGIAANMNIPIAQARTMVSRVNSVMAQMAEVQSPSKVTEYIGRMLDMGLVKGLMGGEDKVIQTAQDLMDKIRKIYEDADKKVDKGMLKIIKTTQTRLAQLGAKLDAKKQAFTDIFTSITGSASGTDLFHGTKAEQDAIDAAQSRLDQLRDVASAISVDADIPATQAAKDQADAAVASAEKALEMAQKAFDKTTGADINTNARDMLNNLKDYNKNLQTLKDSGLNATTLSNLSTGDDTAMQMAKALADGGPAIIDEYDKLQRSIQDQAAITSRIGSNAMYKAGQDSATAIARGFSDQRNAILDQMDKIATDMVNRLRTQIGLEALKQADGDGKGKGKNQTAVVVYLDKKVLVRAIADQEQADNRRNG